jgi:hypothetical protein
VVFLTLFEIAANVMEQAGRFNDARVSPSFLGQSKPNFGHVLDMTGIFHAMEALYQMS